jgi:hypothetical protein
MRNYKSIYEIGCLAPIIVFIFGILRGFIGTPDSYVTLIPTSIIVYLLLLFMKNSAKSAIDSHQNVLQGQRDKFPIQELNELKLEERKPLLRNDFSLFLRSFSTIQYLKVLNTNSNVFPVFFKDLIPTYLNIEFVIARYLEIEKRNNNNKLYAIGGDITEPSTGRLFIPDEDWRSVFESFATKAKSIIIIPGYTESSMWEIEWIKENNMFYKAVFLMPGPIDIDNSKLFASFWYKTQKSLVAINIDCPTYEIDGCMYKLDNNCNLINKKPLNIHTRKGFITNLNYLENYLT